MVFAVKGSLPLDFDGAFISGDSPLTWICNTSKKLGRGASAGDAFESWTAVSTREFGAANKVIIITSCKYMP
jgi:hypothetical protein